MFMSMGTGSDAGYPDHKNRRATAASAGFVGFVAAQKAAAL
jgi:hypothetical protein